MVPPKTKAGKLTGQAMKGQYNVVENIYQIDNGIKDSNGKLPFFSLSHLWPVRESRPSTEALAAKTPLLTGQRVMDGIFPSVLGGTNAVPGAFGCGKTVISQSLSKYSNSDIIV
jgi:V-type H+-transporting ATPase subunit A